MWVWSLGHPLEEEMASHSNILATVYGITKSRTWLSTWAHTQDCLTFKKTRPNSLIQIVLSSYNDKFFSLKLSSFIVSISSSPTHLHCMPLYSPYQNHSHQINDFQIVQSNKIFIQITISMQHLTFLCILLYAFSDLLILYLASNIFHASGYLLFLQLLWLRLLCKFIIL